MNEIFSPYNIAEKCKYCGSSVLTVYPAYGTQHYAKAVCPRHQCAKFSHWVSKPKQEKKQKRSDTKGLLEKYSKGYCELCLRLSDDLPSKTVLHAHHVIEKKDGGDESKENIWIVCTMCHRQIHHQRTYLGHYKAF